LNGTEKPAMAETYIQDHADMDRIDQPFKPENLINDLAHKVGADICKTLFPQFEDLVQHGLILQ
jgi:hypothetical protein